MIRSITVLVNVSEQIIGPRVKKQFRDRKDSETPDGQSSIISLYTGLRRIKTTHNLP